MPQPRYLVLSLSQTPIKRLELYVGSVVFPLPLYLWREKDFLSQDQALLSVTNPSQRVDNDCYQVVERTLQWGTQDTEERKTASGTITCMGSNGVDPEPTGQTFILDIQCEYDVIVLIQSVLQYLYLRNNKQY